MAGNSAYKRHSSDILYMLHFMGMSDEQWLFHDSAYNPRRLNFYSHSVQGTCLLAAILTSSMASPQLRDHMVSAWEAVSSTVPVRSARSRACNRHIGS